MISGFRSSKSVLNPLQSHTRFNNPKNLINPRTSSTARKILTIRREAQQSEKWSQRSEQNLNSQKKS